MKLLKKILLLILWTLIIGFILYQAISIITGVSVDLLRDFDTLLILLGFSLTIATNICIYNELREKK